MVNFRAIFCLINIQSPVTLGLSMFACPSDLMSPACMDVHCSIYIYIMR